MKFKGFSSTRLLSRDTTVEELLERASWVIEFEAADPRAARRKVMREARKSGHVDNDDNPLSDHTEDYSTEWVSYSHKGAWLKPLSLGTRGPMGGIYIAIVPEKSEICEGQEIIHYSTEVERKNLVVMGVFPHQMKKVEKPLVTEK